MKRQEKKYNLKIYRKGYDDYLVYEFYSDDVRYLHRKYREIFYTGKNLNMNYYNLYYKINFADDKELYNELKKFYVHEQCIPFYYNFIQALYC